MLTDAFDGRDLLPLATEGENRTGEHRRAVHEHRAGPAGGVVAAALRAGEAEIAPQHVEQQRARLDGELVGKTVNAQFYEFFLHRDSASSCYRLAWIIHEVSSPKSKDALKG